MPISDRALRLHRDSIVIDPCVQYLLRRTDRTDRSGLTAVGLTIPMPNEDAAETYPRVRDFLRVIHDEPTFCLADSPDAIRRAKAEGKLAHILLSQDACFVGSDPAMLLLWKQLGLRICQLTYNEQNLVGSGCLERHDAGLSQLGRVMVREMERYGITIDLTHAGRTTFLDACAVATRPPIASHSNPRAVVDNPRNIDDDQMKAVAALGGVVCVTTWAPLIWPGTPGMPTLEDWWRCLAYAVDLLGIDHVGVSTDSMGTMGAYPRHTPDPDAVPYGSVTDRFDQVARPPDNNNRQPADFDGIQDFPALVECLCAHGVSDDDIRKLLGGNLLRVFDETWRADWLG
ncbi:MAG: membrane dipeptidase [Vicinamibacterales bacterium]